MKDITLNWLKVEFFPIDVLSERDYIKMPLTENFYARIEFNSIIWTTVTQTQVIEVTMSNEVVQYRPIYYFTKGYLKALQWIEKQLDAQDSFEPFPDKAEIHNVVIPANEVDLSKCMKAPFANNQYKLDENGYGYIFTIHKGYAYTFAYPLKDIILKTNLTGEPKETSMLFKMLKPYAMKQIKKMQEISSAEQAEAPFSKYDNVIQFERSG